MYWFKSNPSLLFSMRRTHPLALRWSYSKSWPNHYNILNFKKAPTFFLNVPLFILGIFRTFRSRKIRPNFLPLAVQFSLTSKGFIINFLYFFMTYTVRKKLILGKLRFPKYFVKSRFFRKKKKSIVCSFKMFSLSFKVRNIVFALFRKLEFFFFEKYRIPVQICPKNLYIFFCEPSFLSLLSSIIPLVSDYAPSPRSIYLLLYSVFYKDSALFCYLLGRELRFNNYSVGFIDNLFLLAASIIKICPFLEGAAFQLSGRIGGATRATSKFLCFGNFSKCSTFSYPLSFSSLNIPTPIGVFGLKIWFFG